MISDDDDNEEEEETTKHWHLPPGPPRQCQGEGWGKVTTTEGTDGNKDGNNGDKDSND